MTGDDIEEKKGKKVISAQSSKSYNNKINIRMYMLILHILCYIILVVYF